VSIFLRDKVQYNNTGRFVLPVSGALPVDVELPGKSGWLTHLRNVLKLTRPNNLTQFAVKLWLFQTIIMAAIF